MSVSVQPSQPMQQLVIQLEPASDGELPLSALYSVTITTLMESVSGTMSLAENRV